MAKKDQQGRQRRHLAADTASAEAFNLPRPLCRSQLKDRLVPAPRGSQAAADSCAHRRLQEHGQATQQAFCRERPRKPSPDAQKFPAGQRGGVQDISAGPCRAGPCAWPRAPAWSSTLARSKGMYGPYAIWRRWVVGKSFWFASHVRFFSCTVFRRQGARTYLDDEILAN